MPTPAILLAVVLLALAHVSAAASSASAPAAPKCRKLALRQEWRTLAPEHQEAWLAGVKCLASIRHQRLSFTAQGERLPGAHSLYDDFAFTHNALDHSAHQNAYFLPWHRWFVHLFDTSLREKCGYTGPAPYWDWTLDVAALAASPIFSAHPARGLGTTGDCTDATTDCLVRDGALAAPASGFALSYPVPHGLRRNLSLFPEAENDPAPGSAAATPSLRALERRALEMPINTTLTPARVAAALRETAPGDFFRFQYRMTQAHNRVHEFVGGDMDAECPAVVPAPLCTGSYSSNDPVFWLHHTQLDRLWSTWQSAHPANARAFSGVPQHTTNASDPRYDAAASAQHVLAFDRLSVGVPVSSTFDHTAQPFCYEYPPYAYPTPADRDAEAEALRSE